MAQSAIDLARRIAAGQKIPGPALEAARSALIRARGGMIRHSVAQPGAAFPARDPLAA